jgi:hypothetical protein
MGLAFGDINCDGHMDAFATSFGDYLLPSMGFSTPNGLDSSRYHLALGTPEGVFTTPQTLPNGLHANPFGWGTGIVDYDNDGDSDVIYYGNLGVGILVSADNPGVILRNEGDCSGTFSWDHAATIANDERVLRQTVQGVALGDLDDDGFVDIVHAAGQYVPDSVPLTPVPAKFGSVFDDTAFLLPTFINMGPVEYEWSGHDVEEGFLGVNLSSGNGNHWVKVGVMGAKGLTAGGAVNRSGIGAIVKFTPKKGKQVMSPVLGGSSYASEHSLVQGFGLGSASKGTVDVLWPGRVLNRLYDVEAGEHVTIPEIPCDFSGDWASRNAYVSCVDVALGDLLSGGYINNAMKTRLRKSALKAYDTTH